jgi:hypothetical protein
MLIDKVSDKLVFAAGLLGVVFAFVAVRFAWQLAGKASRARRARRKAGGQGVTGGAAEEAMAQESTTMRTRRRGVVPAVSDGADAGEPVLNHPVFGEMDAAALLQKIIDDNAPPPLHDGPLPEAIEAARLRPIVFRQFTHLGPGQDGLSFYGGQPIGPADFQWPRSHGLQGLPLTFIMQWDCAQLAELDATGLLPKDGALYCFIDLEWGKDDKQARLEAFLHHPGPTDDWAEIPLPADAPAIFGEEGPHSAAGCTDKVDNPADHVPRVMPRFPFQPVAFEHPRPESAPEEGDRLFWDEGPTGEAMLAIAKQGRPEEPLRELPTHASVFARPFPAYPHDFAAVRHMAAELIKALEWTGAQSAKRRFPDMSDAEREAMLATWLDEAKQLYLFGCQRPMRTPLDQAIADDIWVWLDSRQAALSLNFDRTVTAAVDLSLGVGSAALDRIPREWIDKAMHGHAIASEYLASEYFDNAKHGDWAEYDRLKAAGEVPQVRKVHAPTPAHMFGPPSYVPGYVEELMDEHLLLLELPSHGAPGLEIGEGVLQYLIAPDDLAARRFDRVESVISSY